MTDRETAAQKAGLKDMDLLKLHGPDVPPHVVIADLKGRYPQAFRVDVRNLSRTEYEAAKRDMLAGVRR